MMGDLSHRHRKWLGWFRLLAGFGSVQMVIQVLGFLSGILIVRHLSKQDYAWFTIANSLVSTLGMIADSGVSAAVSSVGGTIWQDNAQFGSLIRTALTLRRKFAILTVIVVTPIFIWLLVKNQAPGWTVAVVVSAALMGFSLQLTAGILGIVVSLRQEIRRMQSLGLAAAVLRLSLVASACLVFFDARVAVIIGLCGPGLSTWFLRQWVKTSVDWNAQERSDYRSRILAVVKKQAPLTIFFCVQGQIIVWLISIFGSEERVAEIGALGRFAMIFVVLSSVMNSIVVPRFARCQNPSVLRRRYWQVTTGFALLAGSFVALSAAFPRPLLWVLGGKYANLLDDVWLMMLSSSLAALFATQFALTYSKAWIAPAMISIPMEIVTQIILIQFLDLSTVRGVLWLSFGSFIPPILLNMIIAHVELKKASLPTEPAS
jgi:O-antigen/teichoic acid export membrane protein